MLHGLVGFVVDLVCCRFQMGAYRPLKVCEGPATLQFVCNKSTWCWYKRLPSFVSGGSSQRARERWNSSGYRKSQPVRAAAERPPGPPPPPGSWYWVMICLQILIILECASTMPPKHRVFNAVMSVELLPYYNNNNDNNTCRAVCQCNISFDEPERKQDPFCFVCLLIQRNDIRQLISQGENEVVNLWSEVKGDSFRSQALFILTTSREASLDCVTRQYISESSQQPVVGCRL